jgi:hypothetical protein
MSVTCALNLLARSLISSLLGSTGTLNDVGVSRSINSFEMDQWVIL